MKNNVSRYDYYIIGLCSRREIPLLVKRNYLKNNSKTKL